MAQLNLRPQLPFFDLAPVGVEEGFVLLLLLLLVPEHALPLLFLLLAWLAQFGLRQHLQTRDFLPDGVRALNSVEVGLGSGASVFVVVVVVVKIGCRQQDEEDTDVVSVTVAADSASTVLAFDVAADAAGDADVTVFVDSFAPVSCTAVFNIFSSPSSAGPCRAAAIAHRGHSPTLNGCSSLL